MLVGHAPSTDNPNPQLRLCQDEIDYTNWHRPATSLGISDDASLGAVDIRAQCALAALAALSAGARRAQGEKAHFLFGETRETEQEMFPLGREQEGRTVRVEFGWLPTPKSSRLPAFLLIRSPAEKAAQGR
jgi:hypothetical protein